MPLVGVRGRERESDRAARDFLITRADRVGHPVRFGAAVKVALAAPQVASLTLQRSAGTDTDAPAADQGRNEKEDRKDNRSCCDDQLRRPVGRSAHE